MFLFPPFRGLYKSFKGCLRMGASRSGLPIKGSLLGSLAERFLKGVETGVPMGVMSSRGSLILDDFCTRVSLLKNGGPFLIGG